MSVEPSECGFFHFQKKNLKVCLIKYLISEPLAKKENILSKKHYTSEELNLIPYGKLDYKDLHMLKYWKENNFLVVLPIKELLFCKDFKLLELVIKRTPLILIIDKNYLKENGGPIKLNKLIEIIKKELPLIAPSILKANNKGASFLFLKKPSLWPADREGLLEFLKNLF